MARPLEFSYRGRKYVGGVAFQIVHARSEHILSTLVDAEQLPAALPLTHKAHLVDRAPGEISVELVQGNAVVRARYTVRLMRHSSSALRFSLDKSRPHDIKDARGYLTATPVNETQSLVTIAVGIDIGMGLKRALFKKPVQRAALSAPAHLRRYIEPH